MHKVPIDYTSIFIGQLDCKTDEMSIRERFGRYGIILGVQVLAKQNIVGRRPSDGGVLGFAFVKYDGRESATRAVKAEVFPFPLPPHPTVYKWGCGA
jgi:RNA recognition motif-containing protein